MFRFRASFWILPLLLTAIGCDSAPWSSPATDPSRKVTWAEFERMDPEQKNDRYVLDNLDDEARSKLEASFRRTRTR